jgi:Poly(hydroxyalcanoate) granule associated protein (phasin)
VATKKQSTKDTEAKAASPDDSLASAIRESTQQIWQAGLGAFNRAQQNSKAAGQWGTLENIFEDRVAQALRRLGIPTAQDVEQLRMRVEELTLTVEALAKNSANSGKAAESVKAPARPPKTAKTSRPSAR